MNKVGMLAPLASTQKKMEYTPVEEPLLWHTTTSSLDSQLPPLVRMAFVVLQMIDVDISLKKRGHFIEPIFSDVEGLYDQEKVHVAQNRRLSGDLVGIKFYCFTL
jgi:hypothetical protein